MEAKIDTYEMYMTTKKMYLNGTQLMNFFYFFLFLQLKRK